MTLAELWQSLKNFLWADIREAAVAAPTPFPARTGSLASPAISASASAIVTDSTMPELLEPKVISFRADLQSEIADILKVEDMACPATMEGLLHVCVALSRYREEGLPLFPEVFICDDAKQVASLIQAQDLIRIGRGPREAATLETR